MTAEVRNTLVYIGTALMPPVADRLELSQRADRCCQRSFKSPANSESRVQGLQCQVGLPCPNTHRMSFSTKRHQSVSRSVLSLFVSGCPSTVLGTVRTVVVDAIKLVLRGWARAHVGQERLKAVPPGADGNTPSAVISIVRILRVTAPSAHTAPDSVLGHPLAKTMRPVQCAYLSAAPEAAARRRVTILEMAVNDRSHSAAVALTEPSLATTRASFRGQADNQQPPVSRTWDDRIPTHRDLSPSNRGATSPAVDAARGFRVAPIIPVTRRVA